MNINCVSVICSSGWSWPTASCSAFYWTGYAQLLQNVVQCSSFQFLGNSYESLGRNLLDWRSYWSKIYLQNAAYFISLYY